MVRPTETKETSKNDKEYEQTNKSNPSGQIRVGAIFERQNMERNKAAHLPAILQLWPNRLYRGSVQRRASHPHNHPRLGDEHDKIRICLTASGHN